jgi:hypothetical protein
MEPSKPTETALFAQLASLREEAERAPKFGLNGKALVLQAARAVAALEAKERAERVAAAAERLAASASASASAGQKAANKKQPKQQAAPARLSPAQLLALVPTAARPFLPYQPRSVLTLAERQNVVDRLLGLHLRALLRTLQLPDSAVEGNSSSGSSGSSSKSTKARALGLASSASASTTDPPSTARLLWRAAGDAAVAQEKALYLKHASKPQYMGATLNLEADVGLWEGSEAVAELKKEAKAGAGGAAKRRRREGDEEEEDEEAVVEEEPEKRIKEDLRLHETELR